MEKRREATATLSFRPTSPWKQSYFAQRSNISMRANQLRVANNRLNAHPPGPGAVSVPPGPEAESQSIFCGNILIL